MRPLYIEGREGTWVGLEAPALLVQRPDHAEQLFPLQRVSRVVVKGHVQWHTEALLACAKHGISVCFLDNDGAVAARWLGQGGDRQCFRQRLADLLGRADGRARYQDWYQAMQRMVVQSCANSLLKHQQVAVGQDELEAFLGQQQNSLPLQPVMPVLACVRGLLFAQVMELFQNSGLDAKSELLQEPWLDLPKDFTELLLWDFRVPVLVWLEGLPAYPDYRQQVGFFDSRCLRVERLHQGLLSKLQRWLVDLF